MNASLPDLSRLTAEQRDAMRAAVLDEARVREARRDLCGWFEYGPPTERGRPRCEDWQRDYLTRFDRLLDEWAALPKDQPRPIWIVNVDAPPQSGKSEGTKRALGYAMARHGMLVGYASYAASLAVSHSVAIRRILRSPEALRVWPWLDGRNARPDDAPKDTEDEWSIPSETPGRLGARLLARGRDGAMTGRVVDLFALDDLYKNEGDYESAAARREVDSFLRSTVLARLMEHGGILLNVGTRWGVNDVRGWIDDIVKELRASALTVRVESWSYPLRAFEGDTMGRPVGAYLTNRWDEEKEAAARIYYGRLASAVLDCRPVPASGGWIKREHLRFYRDDPARRALELTDSVITVDPAGIEEHVGEDETVMHAWGRSGENLILFGARYGRWGITRAWQEFQAMCAAYPRVRRRKIEATVNGLGLSRRCDEHGLAHEKVHTKGKDKHTRGADLIHKAETGCLWVPDPDVWPEWRPVIDALCSAGAPGAHDDHFDAAAWAASHFFSRGSLDRPTLPLPKGLLA